MIDSCYSKTRQVSTPRCTFAREKYRSGRVGDARRRNRPKNSPVIRVSVGARRRGCWYPDDATMVGKCAARAGRVGACDVPVFGVPVRRRWW